MSKPGDHVRPGLLGLGERPLVRRDVTRPAPRLHVGQAVRIAACLQRDKVVRFESSCSIADNTPVVVALEHGPTGLRPAWAAQVGVVATHDSPNED